MGRGEDGIFLYRGYLKCHFFCIGGPENAIFCIGGLKNAIFCIGGLKNAIFCIGGSQNAVFCIGGGVDFKNQNSHPN